MPPVAVPIPQPSLRLTLPSRDVYSRRRSRRPSRRKSQRHLTTVKPPSGEEERDREISVGGWGRRENGGWQGSKRGIEEDSAGSA
uniref:Uncharacterized protein n=1 Tax=Oryza rufipogon TaxID=4529 RepID=A0A0E0MVF3_ORYRU